MRVAVVKNAAEISVRAGSLRVRDVHSNRVLFASSDPVRLEFESTPSGIAWDERSGASSYLSLIALDGSPLRLGGRSYRGRIELVDGPGGILAVNDLDLEDYVAGVINAEISSSWRIEAVKAQAVIARTYALQQKDQKLSEFYDLESGTADQVYTGAGGEDFRVRFALQETAGQVLVWEGRPIRAIYHSSCGGRTEDAEAVWGTPVPYLKSVPCGYCTDAPNFYWTLKMTRERLSAALRRGGRPVGTVRALRVLETTPSGRNARILVEGSEGSVTLTGEALRRTLGYSVLKSTRFVVHDEPGLFRFQGSGSGHGVGLCQWGAKGMADRGFAYRQILDHYYPGTSLERLY